MGKFSNVAHYQDFSELKKILSASAANTYDIEKIVEKIKYKFTKNTFCNILKRTEKFESPSSFC